MSFSKVDLGFSRESEPWRLRSNLFPSKIGGKPAWLSYKNLPNYNDLNCQICGKQLVFLCQVYAPYEDDEDNFHRTLFVFICRNGTCCKRNDASNVKVFRCCLRKENAFYPSEPPDYDKEEDFDASKWVNLCQVCGCLAEKHCGQCKRVFYCGRDHQVRDWMFGHRRNCGKEDILNNRVMTELYPEFEVVIESEELIEEEVNETEELEKFKALELEGKIGSLSEISEEELQQHTQITEDKFFMNFKKRISENPDQILRYEKNGDPLWIVETPKPENIPNCEYCGARRQFEFQLMPQLLSVLKETDVDWGVLAVFTCEKSCSDDRDYKNEFVFKQDVGEN